MTPSEPNIVAATRPASQGAALFNRPSAIPPGAALFNRRSYTLSVAALIATPAQADTLRVPLEYPTIQAAIDAAVAGDVAEIADGKYTGVGNKDLDFLGKAITVRSASGNPTLCVIDCENDGRGFYFHNGEGSNSIVEGLTITRGGVSGRGGGVLCSSSSPTITDCTISENWADHGGGVSCYNDSSPMLARCTIAWNAATSGSGGGGISCHASSNPTIVNCMIIGNSAADGGGVRCSGDSSPTISNCTISGNSGARGAGGVLCIESSPTITNSILWGDAPDEIRCYSSNPIVIYCNVQSGWTGQGNISADPRFAFPNDPHLMPDSPCIDLGTNSPVGGLASGDLDGNARPLDGDGDSVAIADIGAYEFNTVTPSIALSATPLEFFVGDAKDAPTVVTLSLRNCGGGALNWEAAADAVWLTVTPLNGQSNGEVSEISLGADAGGLVHGAYVSTLQISDSLSVNSPRRVDVVLYVTRNLYVPSEYATIQAAIDAALPGDEIILADATYAGAGNRDLDFGGKAITVRSVSGRADLCVIDCEGAGRGFNFHGGEGPDSIVEALTITNGSAYEGGGVYCALSSPTLISCTISRSSAVYGGGVYCTALSSPMVRDCTISSNVALSAYGEDGGGVACHDSSSPTLTGCEISWNSASYGGGVSCEFYSDPSITNCKITHNTASSSGGGVRCVWYSSPTFTNCQFNGNTVTNNGGGIYCNLDSDAVFSNCVVVGNSAGRDGGGIHSVSSSLMFTNCTISGNAAINDGGGVYCYDAHHGYPVFNNCILWHDLPQEVYVLAGDPTLAHSNIQGGWTGWGGWPGVGNIDADPLFVDPDGPDDDPNTCEDNDYRLGPSSPCIDAGDNTSVPADPVDLAGDPRFADDEGMRDAGVGAQPIVDMGAYEFQGRTCHGDMNGDGQIGLPELGALLAHYGFNDGVVYTDGDLDRDGDVDLIDLARLIEVYGTSCP